MIDASLFDRRFFLRLLLSLAVSLLVLWTLVSAFTGQAGGGAWPRLLSVLSATSLLYVGLYALTGLIQAWLRGLRYGVILRTTEPAVPGNWHLFLVSMSRNMFVDMLPARLGELSYIAMLNRGYQVAAGACLSSLAISFVFDLVALALLLLLLLLGQLLLGSLQTWLIGSFLMVALLCLLLLVLLFPVATRVGRFLQESGAENLRLIGRAVAFLESTAATLARTRRAGIFGPVLLLSLGVRLVKYLGLYLLFLAVASPSFMGIDTRPAPVLAALVSAEASAALPVPAFMSFGTYEAGGALAMVALGAEKSASVLIMLALHLWSQVMDYSLGIAAFILFVFSAGRRRQAVARTASRGRGRLLASLLLLLVAAAALYGLFELRKVKKLGMLPPPSTEQGRLLPATARDRDPLLASLHGFIVWSSKRYGNHDIFMFTLPQKKLVRLTDNPHTEYFPRISPDGTRIVFCRSQEPWVSQRNYYAWDVYMLDLATGGEHLIARDANTPTWSADGKRVFFQRNGNTFVSHDLATGREEVVYASGNNLPLASSVILETPSWSASRRQMAVTLRGTKRMTAVVGPGSAIHQVGGGCQLAWAPDSSYLYYVDHGGRGRNAIFRVDPETLSRTLWFDAEGEYSHEYFPKVANSGDFMVYGASTGGHEHDRADYEIFLWPVGRPAAAAVRISYFTGNDCWPDIFLTGARPRRP